MKVIKVLILLLLVNLSYGQTYKKFIKNFNVDQYNEIICDLPGKLKIEIWEKPNCQIILGVKLKTQRESTVDYIVKQNRYQININEDILETCITLPNTKNKIIINGKDMEEDFITIIRVPQYVYVTNKKEILFQ